MNKYYIQVNENRYGAYDFIIDLFNENYMDEKARLGNRENIDTLGECLTMIETFPLSETSQLVEVIFNRRNKMVRLSKLEQLFVDGVNELNKVQNFIIN